MHPEDWERGPIGHLLCVNVEEDVTLEAVQGSIDSWFTAKNVQANSATLHSPAFSKHCKLYFNGYAGSCTETAKKTNLPRRCSDGNWERLLCQTL